MGSLSGLVGLFILVLILATLMPVKYGDIDINQSLDILKNTQGNITLKFQVNETQTPVVKVVYKFVDFVIYSSFEVAELGIILGNEHLGTRGIYLLFWLVILSLLAPIALILVKFIVIAFILVCEIIQSRKEKKKLKWLKERNGN